MKLRWVGLGCHDEMGGAKREAWRYSVGGRWQVSRWMGFRMNWVQGVVEEWWGMGAEAMRESGRVDKRKEDS